MTSNPNTQPTQGMTELREKIGDALCMSSTYGIFVKDEELAAFYSGFKHSSTFQELVPHLMQLIEQYYSDRDQRVKSHREKIERLLTAEVVSQTSANVSKMTVLEKRDFAEILRNEGYSMEQTRRAMGLKHKSNVQYLLQPHQPTNTKEEDGE